MTVYRRFSDIPHFRYRVISADCPWRYKMWSDKGMGRSPDKHYDTMPLEDIEAMTVADIAAPHSVLFFWITGTFLATPRHNQLTTTSWSQRALSEIEGIHHSVMNSWGFECKALAFVWIKLNPTFSGENFEANDLWGGMGKYTSSNAEFCFIGTRGKPGLPVESMVPEVIISPRREHSRKPDEADDRIRRMYRGPRIELFSRQVKAGFDSFSNEIKF